MSNGPEATFQRKVMRKLKTLPNAWFYKSNDRVMVAIPDVIGVCNGRGIFLELKAPKGKPTKLQLHIIEKIRKAGGYAKIVYPNDWEEVFRDLQKIAGSLI